jgi:hypothetical protein
MMRLRGHLDMFLEEWKQPVTFDWKAGLACILGGILLYPLMARLPVVGWDWYYWFLPGNIDFYPPWTRLVLAPLTALPWRTGLALLNGITLMTVAVAAARQARPGNRRSRLIAAGLALVSPPVLMALWLGNIEGLVLLGLVALPPGVILALTKPHLSIWALLARRRWLIWTAGWGVLSLLIWGWWPGRTFGEMGRLSENFFTIGWYNLGWPLIIIGAVLLLFSSADPQRLLAAGFFLTPYLMPNHMLLLLPALGGVEGWKRWFLWGVLWVSGLASGVGAGAGRYLGLAFPLAVWFLLARSQPQELRFPLGVPGEAGQG